QSRTVRLPAARLRPHHHARSRLAGGHQNRERGRAAGLRDDGRRRPRCGAVPGKAVRRVRPRIGNPAARPGDLARLRRPEPEAQSRPRRIKFLVKTLGIEEFKRLVLEERAKLPVDTRWTSYLEALPSYGEQPLKPGAALNGASRPAGYDAWARSNVYQQ